MVKVYFNPSTKYYSVFNKNLDKECVYNLFNSRKDIKDKDIDPYHLIKEIGETYSNDNPIKCEFF